MSTPESRAPTRIPPREVTTADGDPSLGALFGQLAQDSSTLIRQEIALAKAEFRSSMRETARGATRIGIAAGIVVVGALVLVAFLVVLLGDLLDNYWLSALLVGAALTLIGAFLALGGIRKLKAVQLAPEATIETLKEDRDWAKSEVQQVKQDLRA